MTIAETRGKISSTGRNLHDQLEDLLTSDVFTACKYVRPATLLLPFLSAAVSIEGKNARARLPDQRVAAKYFFWPRLSRGEPDLAISIEETDGSKHLVIVEAKYLSGKSSNTLDEEELELATAPSDQLANQYADLLDLEHHLPFGGGSVKSRMLIYVTAHRSIPRESLEESMREIDRFHSHRPAGPIYWTSWFELVPLLDRSSDVEDWETPILHDLSDLMKKKGFLRFGGIDLPDSIGVAGKTLFYRFGSRSGGGRYKWDVPYVNPHPWYSGDLSSGRGYFAAIEVPKRLPDVYESGA